MPLLIPWAMEIAMIPGLLFPAWLAWREWREGGTLHPAWPTGIAVPVVLMILSFLLAIGPLGDAGYRAAVSGTPGQAVPGLEFGTPPPM
jgi:hypothetical protein